MRGPIRRAAELSRRRLERDAKLHDDGPSRHGSGHDQGATMALRALLGPDGKWQFVHKDGNPYRAAERRPTETADRIASACG